jgi:hypothetical protein
MLYWTDVDHSFCEESLLGIPEYYNSISSLFFVFFGFHGLMNLQNELFIDILYSKLIIIGIGSTGYHWYGNIGWGLFDEIPMILSIFTGIIYVDNVYFLHHSSCLIQKTIIESSELKNFIYYRKLKILTYLFTMCYFIIINVMSNYRKFFPILFAFSCAYFYYKLFLLLNIINPVLKSKINNKIFYSLLTITSSGIIWVITENLCKCVKYRFLIIGHPLWHVFVGHGFYNVIQILYFIKLHHCTFEMHEQCVIKDENYLCYGLGYLLEIKNIQKEKS